MPSTKRKVADRLNAIVKEFEETDKQQRVREVIRTYEERQKHPVDWSYQYPELVRHVLDENASLASTLAKTKPKELL